MTGSRGAGSLQVVLAGFSAAIMEALAAHLSRRGVVARFAPLATVGEHLQAADTVLVIEADAGDAPTVAACAAARSAQPGTRLLLLTRRGTAATRDLVRQVDASGWVTFQQHPDELLAAVQHIHQGHQVAQPLPLDESAAPHDRDRNSLEAAALSDRELEVLRGLLTGASSHTIADALGISHNTVRTHVRNVLRKLNVGSRHEAATLGLRAGLRPLDRVASTPSGDRPS